MREINSRLQTESSWIFRQEHNFINLNDIKKIWQHLTWLSKKEKMGT